MVAVLSLLCLGFSEGNPRPHFGSGEGDALVPLTAWGLALDVPLAGGTSGGSWWFVVVSC